MSKPTKFDQELHEFIQAVEPYLANKYDRKAIFNQNEFEDWIEDAYNGQFNDVWFDAFDMIPIIIDEAILDESEIEMSLEQRTQVENQVRKYKMNLCYNYNGLEHGIVKPLTNFALYLMLKSIPGEKEFNNELTRP